MVKKRLIPKLLIQNQKLGKLEVPVLVTTRNYTRSRRVGDAVSQAKIYEAQLADELVVLNIDSRPVATDRGLLDLIRRLATETFMPLTVGGGVAALDDFALLLEHGADKVSINTAALRNSELVGTAAARFGAQCVVASIDLRTDAEGRADVVSARGTVHEGRDPVEWAVELAERGAGEILLTDANRDGGGEGVNWEICAEVAERVAVPVVLSGGCGLARHFSDGFLKGGASGVAAGSFFALRDQSPMQTRSHIRNAGVDIRMLV